MENQHIKNATTPYHFDEGDDGSLASLGLDTDRERKSFSCPAVRHTELVDKKIWVLDFFGALRERMRLNVADIHRAIGS